MSSVLLPIIQYDKLNDAEKSQIPVFSFLSFREPNEHPGDKRCCDVLYFMQRTPVFTDIQMFHYASSYNIIMMFIHDIHYIRHYLS